MWHELTDLSNYEVFLFEWNGKFQDLDLLFSKFLIFQTHIFYGDSAWISNFKRGTLNSELKKRALCCLKLH